MIPVVIDTNIFISSLLSHGGNSAMIIEWMIQGKIHNFSSREIIEEVLCCIIEA